MFHGLTGLLAGAAGLAGAWLAWEAVGAAGAVFHRLRARWRAPLAGAIELLGVSGRQVAAAQAGLAVAGAALVALLRPPWWPAFLILVVFAAYLAPAAAAGAKADDYRDAVRTGLADAAEFIDLHVSAGCNVPQALAGTCWLVAGPLRRELRRVLAAVAAGASPAAALREFGRRAADPDADAVARHLAAAWTMSAPGREVFAALGATLRRLEQARVLARTRRLPVLFDLITGLALLDVALLAGVPALAWFMSLLRG